MAPKDAKENSILSLDLFPEGTVPDFVTGKPVRETRKELVRQEVERALSFEYGISPDDMQPDFKIRTNGTHKRIDIAVLDGGGAHNVETLRRAVICRPQPNVGARSVIKLRDHEQAAEDLDELKEIMKAAEGCTWGLWTNGIERFFLKKERRTV